MDTPARRGVNARLYLTQGMGYLPNDPRAGNGDTITAWAACAVDFAADPAQHTRPRVLHMGSRVQEDVDRETTRKVVGSDVDDITNLLEALPIHIGYEPTTVAWQNQPPVVDQ